MGDRTAPEFARKEDCAGTDRGVGMPVDCSPETSVRGRCAGMFKEAPRPARGLKAPFGFGAARGLVAPDGTVRLVCWADEVRGDVAPLGERMADFGAPEACLSSLSVQAYMCVRSEGSICAPRY